MIGRAFVVVSTLLMVALQPSFASAQEIKAGDLVITEAWSRATPGGAKVGSGYLTIENKGAVADRLLGGTADIASKVDVHEMATINGVMTMRQVDTGVSIAPGARVKLAPSAFHLMLTDLKRPLKQGDRVQITLSFEKAGNVAVVFDVLGVGAKGPEAASTTPLGPRDQGKMNADHGKMKM